MPQDHQAPMLARNVACAPIVFFPAATNARFTPNRDQLRTDLRVEKYWISWTREQSLNIYRQTAS